MINHSPSVEFTPPQMDEVRNYRGIDQHLVSMLRTAESRWAVQQVPNLPMQTVELAADQIVDVTDLARIVSARYVWEQDPERHTKLIAVPLTTQQRVILKGLASSAISQGQEYLQALRGTAPSEQARVFLDAQIERGGPNPYADDLTDVRVRATIDTVAHSEAVIALVDARRVPDA